MLIDAPPQKVFEKPDAGVFLGILADVIYEDNVQTKNFGLKNKVTFKWILNAKDKEGNYYTVISKKMNRTMGLGSDLYKAVQELLNSAPPVPFDPETLIGTVRNLVITRTTGVNRHGQPAEYANIAASYLPKPGETFAIPQGFVRAKDKPARGSQPAAGTSAVSASAPVAASAAAAVDDSPEVEF